MCWKTVDAPKPVCFDLTSSQSAFGKREKIIENVTVQVNRE